MTERRRALGRGLSALLPVSDRSLQHIPLDAIIPNSQQPRDSFDDESLMSLVESIREHGILQPLVVRALEESTESGARYELIAGERRWRAARLANLEKVPAVVREANSQEQLELALVENLQREDLDPVEEARAYRELQARFGMTQEQIAERVSKSRSAIANSLRLLTLPPSVLDMIRDGDISEGHGRALLALSQPDLILQVAQKITERGLSVREAESFVRGLLQPADKKQPAGQGKKQEEDDPFVASMEDHLRSRLNTKVTLSRGRKGGKLIIHFYSDEELEQIYQIITGESF